MRDEFNFIAIDKYIPNLDKVIDSMLDKDFKAETPAAKSIRRSAEIAYGLLHKQYIETPKGMEKMHHLYQSGVFGTCPRALCDSQKVLPYGEKEVPNSCIVKLYCPCCQDLYLSPNDDHLQLDGAYFGPNFAHMFVLNYPLLFTKQKQSFSGTLFGFKVHKSSENHPPKVVFDVKSGKCETIPRPCGIFADPNTTERVKRNLVLSRKRNAPGS